MNSFSYYLAGDKHVPDHETNARTAYVVTPYNSWEARPGAVHLAEHVWADALFGPTSIKPYPKFLYTNAFTDTHGMTSVVNYLVEDEEDVLNELQRRVAAAVPTSDILERERKIVTTESKEYYRHDWTRFWFASSAQLSPQNLNIMGSEDDIASVTLSEVEEVFKRGREASTGLILGRKHGDALDYSAMYGPKSLDLTPINGIKHLEDPALGESGLAYVGILFNYNMDPIVRAAVSAILAGASQDLDSPLYHEVREKHGLVYGIWAEIDTKRTQQPIVMFSCSKENVQAALDVTMEAITSGTGFAFKDGYADRVERLVKYQRENRTLLKAHQHEISSIMNGYHFGADTYTTTLKSALTDEAALDTLQRIRQAPTTCFIMQ